MEQYAFCHQRFKILGYFNIFLLFNSYYSLSKFIIDLHNRMVNVYIYIIKN